MRELWIDIQDQEPPDYIWLLVLSTKEYKDSYINIVRYNSHGNIFEVAGCCCGDIHVNGEVTHWMHLPKKPKGQ